MTEDDVAAMEAAVLATPIDPAVERAWAEKTRDELRQNEQYLMAEWRMYRHTRQDAKMAAAAKLLKTLRASLAYVEKLLEPAPPEA